MGLFQVRRRLSEVFAQAQAEIETLKKTENELRTGQSKLEDLGRRLDQEQVLSTLSFAIFHFTLLYTFQFFRAKLNVVSYRLENGQLNWKKL